MNPRKATAVVALLLINQLAFADASYQSTTQITGGTLVDTMQKMSFLSHSIKDMLAPITTTTIVHGNQKAVVSKDSTEITDLDRECIIPIDNLKKTYTITTFAEMRQAFQNMPKQMDKMQTQMKQAQPNQPQQPSDIKTTFDVKVNNTGATKVVNGLEAQEQVITMTMKVTMTNPPPPPQGQPADPNAPASMEYTVTTDTWVAPDPPEIKEIADFDIRFGQKLMQGVDMKEFAEQMKQMQASANAASAQLLGGQPGASDAMAQMAKEMAKLKGTRVLEITSMGGLAPAGTVTTASDSTTPPPSGQSVAGDVATNTGTQTASGEASTVGGKTGIFTNALSSSAFSAFHHKKAAPAPAPATPPPTTATGAPAMQTVVLMSTTTQKANFSQSPASLSAFQIPPGFKKVPSPIASMGQ
jgi:hypothetical protein